jgi:hypothetical protein
MEVMNSIASFENISSVASNLGVRFEPGKAPGGAVASWEFYKSKTAWAATTDTSPKAKPPPTMMRETVAAPEFNQIVGQLFDARANAKLVVSSLAMHLPSEWRAKINKQLDRLLDVEEWEDGDHMLLPSSMQSFLRFVIYADAKAVPSLGMSPLGFVLAAWRTDTRRLTIEFQPRDRCRAVISHLAGDDQSIVTFTGLVSAARTFVMSQEFSLG